MADGAVAARLRRLEDADEIRLLLASYGECLDRRDFVAYSELFAEDGELVAPLGEARGREAIRALLERRIGSDPPEQASVHLIASPLVRIDGDRATSKVIWAYVTGGDDGYPLLLQLGFYDDVLVREDGRWRFARRVISRELGFSPLE